ncbi:MAG: aminopeptidase P family protein [Syntrophomonadaceae bacterium]|nr:aminopeptidase P family protein [Syntrophomonadaceae bacterium]
MNHGIRVKKLLDLMAAERFDGLLISDPANVFYLSGFTGEGFLLITENKRYLLTDPRFTEQGARESPDFEVHNLSAEGWTSLTSTLNRVGFESAHITYQRYQVWAQTLGVKLVAAPLLVEQLRLIKDEEEIERIRTAVRIGDEVFRDLLPEIRPGISERHLGMMIDHGLRVRGCDKEAFDTIVVSGRRSSLPHGRPTEKVLEVGDVVTFDFGGFYRNYAGDMTRTVVVGKSCARSRDIYSRVLEAQITGVEAVAPGKTCREVDRAVREVFARNNLDQYFVHSTGHGVGLSVHEAPSLSGKDETVLQEGMVVTVEPGIYIPGWGGVRIEDVVLVKGNGREVLTGTSKDLMVI